MERPDPTPRAIETEVDSLSIKVEGLHVRYRVREDKQLTLSELFQGWKRRARTQEVHALKGIDLQVRIGESVGLLGNNGSGKSTLLRCIAGVQPIERGRVLLKGQAQLLAVNAALDGKLSGRRNVYLGGLAMGLSRSEVDHAVDSVIEFTELAEAIDRPMRTYSSGMRARLAFAIATMAKPEILLIDEALAVGDRRFRRKSLQRIRELRDQAGTVVMVTHNLNEIRSTCPRSIWLDDGKIIMDGETDHVLSAYESND